MQVDRICFTKNINGNISLEEIIKEYFDEVMALYDLIGVYNNFSIEGSIENAKIRFDITFNSKKDATFIFSVVNGCVINKYNKLFKCNVQHIDNMLCIMLGEV